MKRRWHLVVMGCASIGLAVANPFGAAHADGGPKFGSYTVAATTTGFEMWEDEPSANAHPEGGGQVPYSTSALSSGGLGYGLSSVAWPGATEANADKVALLLFPKTVDVPNGPSVPVPDAVTALFQQTAPMASYPIRAEARTGEDTPDRSLDTQAATLKAHADPLLANATATMKGATGQAGFSFGNAETIASSTLNDNAGAASAESKITKLDIGGVIKIDSVTSTANATTTASDSQSSGSTVVQGMTIGGQDAYVDDSGVHIGKQGQPANAIASQIANNALKNGGFSFYVSQPQQEAQGATASYTAGSLLIMWQPPDNPNENVFVISLGGSRASVTAQPAVDVSGGFVSSPSVGNTSPVVAAPTATKGGISSTPQTSPPAAAAPATKPKASPATSRISATFTGLAGQAILGLLGSGLLFFGFRRVADDIIDRAPTICPLDPS
jgi:hypothetical protein